jgi:hypothetical protein
LAEDVGVEVGSQTNLLFLKTVNNKQDVCDFKGIRFKFRIGVNCARSETVEAFQTVECVIIPSEVQHRQFTVQKYMVTLVLYESIRDNLLKVFLVEERLRFV